MPCQHLSTLVAHCAQHNKLGRESVMEGECKHLLECFTVCRSLKRLACSRVSMSQRSPMSRSGFLTRLVSVICTCLRILVTMNSNGTC